MNFPYKKALVTGGAGFIGGHIVEELTRMDVEVVSVDYRHYPGIDITNYGILEEQIHSIKPDIIFHNACSKKNVCQNNPFGDLNVNIQGTLNLLEIARTKKVKKFIHASTGSVYGEPAVFPQTEEHPLNPVSHYGVSKLAGEKYAMLYHKMYGLDVTVLRYFHVYGPRQNDDDDQGGVVAIFNRRLKENKPLIIYGDGDQTRHFTYVKDVVRANLFVATHPEAAGQVYNCARRYMVSIRELAEEMNFLAGKSQKNIYKDWKPGDIVKFDVSSEKLVDLGFIFETAIQEGLRETMLC